MEENRKKPQIRFAGYTDDWEQRKLGEYVSITSGEAPSKFEEGTELYVKVDDLNYNDKYVVDTQNKVAEHSTVKRVTKGSVVFPKRGAAIMTNKVRIMGIDSYMDTNMMALTSEKLDSEFLYNIISKEGLYKIADTSTIPQINNKHIEPYEVTIPSLDEQRRIGAYFRSLDHLITLHQRKYNKLVDVKKSMLEKMFPKNGEKKPEIRFGGFTDDWEQRKLSEIYASIGNAFVGTATPYYVEQGHFYLESNNIKDGQINHNSEVFINDEFYERQKEKWLHTGDMVMVQSGHVGHAAVIPEELDNSAAHALIMFREPKVKIEPYFLNYQYQTNKIKKKIEGITTGNTIKHILASDMQEFVVDLPDYNEQKQIGDYFRNLDNLITLHQREVEKLKNNKKSMLEKMFI